MEHTRRKEAPVWLDHNVHIWKKNNIVVVNARDASEQLRGPHSDSRTDEASRTPDEESLLTEGTNNNASEKISESSKQKSVDVLLELMHRSSEGQNAPPTRQQALSNFLNIGGGSAAKAPETKTPSFPESKSEETVSIEFVQGVNLPGGKSTTPPLQSQPQPYSKPQLDSVQTVALFHDPVWGEVSPVYDTDSLAMKEEEKTDAFSSLKLTGFSEGVTKNESMAPGTSTNSAAPLVFTPPATMNEVVFQAPTHSTVVTSSPSQMTYPQGIGLGPANWTATPQAHASGVAVHPYQFVSVPVSFMPQGAMMTVPQTYRVPYHYFPMHPQVPQLAALQHQPGAFQASVNPEAHLMMTQKFVTPQNLSARPGTNVGAAPFIPGRKSI